MRRVSRLPYLFLIAGAAIAALHAQEPAPSSTADLSWPYAYRLPHVYPVPLIPVVAEYDIELNQPLLVGRSETLRTRTQVARDSNGRIRQELRGYVPAWQSARPPLLSVTLSDPQSNLRQTLDSLGRLDLVQRIPVSASVKSAYSAAKTEDLGSKTIDGVQVRGIRATWIRASSSPSFGPPARVVDETWYSNELQLIVSEQETDSAGRVVSISLAHFDRREPRPSLFKIPRQDYPLNPYRPVLLPLWAGEASAKSWPFQGQFFTTNNAWFITPPDYDPSSGAGGGCCFYPFVH